MAPALLDLPDEIRLEILRWVMLPYITAVTSRGADVHESDPSSYFAVLGHCHCFVASTTKLCDNCTIQRPMAIDAARFMHTGRKEGSVEGVLSTCRLLHQESMKVFYGGSEILVPYAMDDDNDEDLYERWFDAPEVLEYFYGHTSQLALDNIHTITVAFEENDDLQQLDQVCCKVVDRFPQLQRFVALVDTAAFEGDVKAFKSKKLTEIGIKIRVIVEVTSFQSGTFLYYAGLKYDDYLDAIRSDIHEELDPLVRKQERRWSLLKGAKSSLMIRTRPQKKEAVRWKRKRAIKDTGKDEVIENLHALDF